MTFIHKVYIIALFLIVSCSFPFYSEGSDLVTEGEAVENEKSSFDAGKFVVEHVTDNHEWHIATFGHTHLTIPLPILLYSKNSGLHLFLSSKFHHGNGSYQGFSLGEGKYEGKIVEVSPTGEVVGTPFDFSITKTVAGIIFSSILILWVFLTVAGIATSNVQKAPSGLLGLVEPVILFIRDDIAKSAIGEKKYERFMPILLTLFFFILLNNLMGLIPLFPFGANVTGNISITMALALFTFITTTISGNKHYWKEIYNPEVPWWMKFPLPIMPLVEFFGLFTKPFVLMVRLFANMMAGHLIVTVFVSLIFIFSHLMGPAAGWMISPVSILFSVFIIILDILVSFIQAYVFTLLSALYFGMATKEHH